MDSDYFVGTLKFNFTVDERNGRLNHYHDKNLGKRRRRKVEKSCVIFLLRDPGWCVHKSDVQNKWDCNTTPKDWVLTRDATVELYRSPETKFKTPGSCQFFPTSRIGNHTRLMPSLLNVMTKHCRCSSDILYGTPVYFPAQQTAYRIGNRVYR